MTKFRRFHFQFFFLLQYLGFLRNSRRHGNAAIDALTCQPLILTYEHSAACVGVYGPRTKIETAVSAMLTFLFISLHTLFLTLTAECSYLCTFMYAHCEKMNKWLIPLACTTTALNNKARYASA